MVAQTTGERLVFFHSFGLHSLLEMCVLAAEFFAMIGKAVAKNNYWPHKYVHGKVYVLATNSFATATKIVAKKLLLTMCFFFFTAN